MTIEDVKKYFLYPNGKFNRRKFLNDDSEFKKFIVDNVKFFSVEELIYRLKNDDFEDKHCFTCGKEIEFTKSKMKFRKYCSPHCMAINEEFILKRHETLISKYRRFKSPCKTGRNNA